MKLPEGRITHVNLQDKVVVREPKIIKEKEVIIKEPEVKIDPIKPQKPLDKTFLKDVKIKPLDISDEISKEKTKVKPIIKKETTEGLGDIKPKASVQKPALPLDKSLITESKIEPLVLNQRVIDDYKKKEPNKPIQVLDVDKKQPEKVIDNKATLEKTEVSKDMVSKSKSDSSLERPSKFVNENVIKEKPDLLKPMENKEKPIGESVNEKELITNLQIVDFDRMVKAVKNLSTVYTM